MFWWISISIFYAEVKFHSTANFAYSKFITKNSLVREIYDMQIGR